MSQLSPRSVRVHVLSAGVALALLGASAQAANRVDLHGQSVAQLNRQYHAAAATVGLPARAADRHAEIAGLDAESALQVIATAVDADGTKHYRYQQTFRGVPVFGEHVVVSEAANGDVRSLFGRKVEGLAREIAASGAKVNGAQALSIAKSHALGSHATSMVTERESSRQMVYVDDAGRAHMSYVVSFFADAPKGGNPSRPFVIVDADSGAVLKKWDGLETALVGTGPGGNAKTGQYEFGSGGLYGYLDVAQSGSTCTMNNANVKSVNLNGGTTGSTAFSYTCPRNTFKAINGAYSPINDAHFFGGIITKMYPAFTGYNALNIQLVMRVHYSANYENAFWDGTQMSFGDGATTFYPLVNADVSGHEVSHGFTEQHSNLTYSGQSGGMNEAFSDMGGEATENYWKGTNDFDVGREIYKSATGALRYMCNPTQDGRSIDNAANYTSSLDVHNSSGVYNKAFCLLAKTSGWGTATAFKAFARANALYWTPSSTFNSGACGVQTAATDIGKSAADVAAAFSAVGVSCGTTPPPPPPPGGNLLLNPGFESGAASWGGTSGVITNSTSRTPRSGSYYAWLVGYGTTHTETLSQSVAITAGKTSATLSYYLKIDTAETTTTSAYDTLKVQVFNSAGTLLKSCTSYSNLNKSTGYVQHTCDLSSYIGQTVQIRFTGSEDSSLQTSFIIDDTSVTAS